MHSGMTLGAFFRYNISLRVKILPHLVEDGSIVAGHFRIIFFYSSGAFSEGGQRDKGKAAHKGTAKVTKDIDPNKLEKIQYEINRRYK